MKLKIKICGITNREDALRCIDAGANALGFIFYKKSPRYIEPSIAATIIGELPSYIAPVGVFVNEKRPFIEQTIAETNIRIIQFSGDEMPEDCNGYSLKVWKAFRFSSMDEVEIAQRYSISAALIDGVDNNLYGGTGTLADFSIASAVKQFHPVVLAGGLNPENVLSAIHHVQPYAIDVNSGIERSPGKKDEKKIASLFNQLQKVF